MADVAGNGLFDSGRQKFLEGTIHWLTDTIKVVLYDQDDGHPQDSWDFYDDVVVAGRVKVSDALQSPSSTAGVADAEDVTLATVVGDECEWLIIFSDTGGGDGTDPLIAYIETATGLPVTPNGGDIQIVWDSGSNKIFRL